MRIKVTKQQDEFIKSTATQIHVNGKNYYFIPWWFKELDEYVFEEIHPERLSDEVKDVLRENRDEIIGEPEGIRRTR